MTPRAEPVTVRAYPGSGSGADPAADPGRSPSPTWESSSDTLSIPGGAVLPEPARIGEPEPEPLRASPSPEPCYRLHRYSFVRLGVIICDLPRPFCGSHRIGSVEVAAAHIEI